MMVSSPMPPNRGVLVLFCDEADFTVDFTRLPPAAAAAAAAAGAGVGAGAGANAGGTTRAGGAAAPAAPPGCTTFLALRPMATGLWG